MQWSKPLIYSEFLKGGYIKRSKLPNAKVFISPYNDIFTIDDFDLDQIFTSIKDSADWWFDKCEIGHREEYKFMPVFQTKNPARYFDYVDLIPKGSWLGTTIETDDICGYEELHISKAPNLANRFHNINKLKQENDSFKYFITLEPIMKPDKSSKIYGRLLFWMKELKPDLIFIGADTGKNNLPEPSRDELVELIEGLQDAGLKVYLKSNIQRIIGDDWNRWNFVGDWSNI